MVFASLELALWAAALPGAWAWPWGKMGISFPVIGDDQNVRALAGTNIAWANNWWNRINDWDAFGEMGIQYIPMVWGVPSLRFTDYPPMDILFAFNEPNNRFQAGGVSTDPGYWAYIWPEIEGLAASHGVQVLVGPSVNFDADTEHPDPSIWYHNFFGACLATHGRHCRVDAIAIHIYNCKKQEMIDRIDKFRVFGKQIWVTEFACGDNPFDTPCGDKSWQCQCEYIKEVVPYLEWEPLVSGYSWFSKGSIYAPDPYVGESTLIHNGQLTDLGRCYSHSTYKYGGGCCPMWSGNYLGCCETHSCCTDGQFLGCCADGAASNLSMAELRTASNTSMAEMPFKPLNATRLV